MTRRRKPLSVREGRSDRDFDALHDGVPDWLEGTLWGWFEDAVYTLRTHYPNEDTLSIIRHIEVGIQRSLGSDGIRDTSFEYAIRNAFREHPPVFLDAIDYVIPLLGSSNSRKIDSLEFSLHMGGSAWSAGPTGLIRRVPEEAQAAAEMAIAPGDRAAHHLKEAWADIFGRNPDPSDGYIQAVRAVEAVVQPVVSPKDAKATLGTMIPVMRDKPSKWTVSLEHIDPEEQVRQVAGMMELLWKGEHDRHGKSDEGAPLSVSQEEAEAAIHLAVTLVQWFRSGVVKLRNP